MSVTRLLTAASSVACLTGVLLAPPVSAVIVDEGSESGEFGGIEQDFCDVEGLTVEFDGSFEVRWQAHAQGPDGIAYYVTHVSVETTYTNVATGAFAVEMFRALEKDHKIVLGEDTLTITVLATGPAMLKEEGRRVVGADPGQVRFTFVVDHGGTPTDPSDDTFVEDLGITKESTGRTDDFCESAVATLT